MNKCGLQVAPWAACSEAGRSSQLPSTVSFLRCPDLRGVRGMRPRFLGPLRGAAGPFPGPDSPRAVAPRRLLHALAERAKLARR